MTDYLVYDVFAEEAFGGNPLAVITDATDLPERLLQKIAREFNFSETVFVTPPDDRAHTARVRIFTPTMEVPFAGHPTIGTAVALADLGRGTDLVLELGIGPIPCTVEGTAARFVIRRALERRAEPDPALVAACLGLREDAVRTDRQPPVQASLGLEFVLVELADAGALSTARPVVDAVREGAARHPGQTDFAIYCYIRDGGRIDARMFAPLDDIPEDPATGSAAAALAACLGELEGASQNFDIRQGADMGRPSRIEASVTVAEGKAVEVAIGGNAVRTMEGRLVL